MKRHGNLEEKGMVKENNKCNPYAVVSNYIYIMSSGWVNCLGFAPSSQNLTFCPFGQAGRSVRYPDSLRFIRTSALLVDET